MEIVISIVLGVVQTVWGVICYRAIAKTFREKKETE